MTKAELVRYLESVPDNAEMYYCNGRDAWPLQVTVFQESDGVVAYCGPDTTQRGRHRNVPQHPET